MHLECFVNDWVLKLQCKSIDGEEVQFNAPAKPTQLFQYVNINSSRNFPTTLQDITRNSRNTSHPPPFRVLLTSLQLTRRNITRLQDNTLRFIPPPIIPSHPKAQTQSNSHTSKTKARADNARHLIPRSALLSEDIRSHQTHCVGGRNQDGRQDRPLVLIWSVVVVPC